jgi:hypothetical protein
VYKVVANSILSVYVLQFYYDDRDIYIPHRFVFVLWAGTSISAIFYTPPHRYRRAIVSVCGKEAEKKTDLGTLLPFILFPSFLSFKFLHYPQSLLIRRPGVSEKRTEHV